MRLRSLGFSFVLVLNGLFPCVGQQSPGPATLENVGATEEPVKSAAPEAKPTDAGPARIAGAVSRPKDGVQHPDLDKAWAKYDAAVTKASEGIRTGIAKRKDLAATKGDLDAVTKWEEALNKFDEGGEVPPEDEANKFVSSAVAERKRAIDDLRKAYEKVVKALTMVKKFDDARRTQTEKDKIVALADAAHDKDEVDGWKKKEKPTKLEPKPDPQVAIKQAVVGAWDSAGFTWRFGADGSMKVDGWGEGVWYVMADGTIRVTRRYSQRPEEVLTDVLKFVEPGMMERTDGQVLRKK